ncbi:peptidoglycan-binding protein LysM [Maricaulis sp.]|uniref:peptidoglycan-binding protein LysM n=1 Tax=Maricaulis sp. TaxID=1486257 RepID=UPI003A8E8F29
MFNLINVIANAGKSLGFDGDKDDGDKAELVRKEITGHDIEGADGVELEVVKDKVVLKGKGLSQAAKEKLLMAAGNIKGVASVEDKMIAAKKEAAGRFHTVKSGDTLSKIAQDQYGKASAYPKIFEANKPMLSHPDKIYPGQLLRIPGDDDGGAFKGKPGSFKK